MQRFCVAAEEENPVAQRSILVAEPGKVATEAENPSGERSETSERVKNSLLCSPNPAIRRENPADRTRNPPTRSGNPATGSGNPADGVGNPAHERDNIDARANNSPGAGENRGVCAVFRPARIANAPDALEQCRLLPC